MKFPSSLLIPTLTFTTLGVSVLGVSMMSGSWEQEVQFTTQQVTPPTFTVSWWTTITTIDPNTCMTTEIQVPGCHYWFMHNTFDPDTCKKFLLDVDCSYLTEIKLETDWIDLMKRNWIDSDTWIHAQIACDTYELDETVITGQYDCKEDGKTAMCDECKKAWRPDPDCDYDKDWVPLKHDCNDEPVIGLLIWPWSTRSKWDQWICSENMEYCEWISWKRIDSVNQIKPKTEACNWIDDDCDGTTDENVCSKSCIIDADCNSWEKCYQWYPKNTCALVPMCNNASCSIPSSTNNIDNLLCKHGKVSNNGNFIQLWTILKRWCEWAKETKECNCMINPNIMNLPWFNTAECSVLNELISWYQQKKPNNYTVLYKWSIEYANSKSSRTQEAKQEYLKLELSKAAFMEYEKDLNQEIRSCGFQDTKEFVDEMSFIDNKLSTISRLLEVQFPTIESSFEWRKDFSTSIAQFANSSNNYNKPWKYLSDEVEYIKYKQIINTIPWFDQTKINKANKAITAFDAQHSTESSRDEFFEAFNYLGYIAKEKEKRDEKFNINKIEKFVEYNKNINNTLNKFWKDTITYHYKQIKDYQNEWLKQLTWQVDRIATFEKNYATCQKNGWINKYQSYINLYDIIFNRNNTMCFPLFSNENRNYSGKWIYTNSIFQKIHQIKTFFKPTYFSMFGGVNHINTSENNIVLWWFQGMRNGLNKFVIGSLVNLRYMSQSMWYWDEAKDIAFGKIADDIKDIFNITTSNKQLESLINKDGSFNIHLANISYQVGESIGQMLPLVKAWAALGQRASKSFNVTVGTANKLWLFSSSMISNIWSSYINAQSAWLDNASAFWFSLLESIGTSVLELFSPNKLIRGDFWVSLSKLAWNTAKWNTFKHVAKTYMWEILEENAQESMQLMFTNTLQYFTNEQMWANFVVQNSWKDFAETSILTTLSTAFASIPWSIQQLNQQRQDAIGFIIADNTRYQNYISQLNNIISNPTIIPQWLSVDAYIKLKQELQMYKEYYPWKKSEFDFTIMDTINNSKLRDQWIDAVRARIIQLVKQHVGIDITISDAQMDLIKQAHEIKSVMWEITIQQLIAKVRLLHQAFDEIIYKDVKTKDNKEAITRLLLESGICGQTLYNKIYILNDIDEFIELLLDRSTFYNDAYLKTLTNLIIPYIQNFLKANNLEWAKFMIWITWSDGRWENNSEASIPEFIVYFDENVWNEILNPEFDIWLNKELENLRENWPWNTNKSKARFETNPSDPINAYYINPSSPTSFPTRFWDITVLYDPYNFYNQLKNKYVNDMNNESSNNQKNVKDNFNTALKRLQQNDGSNWHSLYNSSTESIVYWESWTKIQIWIKQSALRITQYGISNLVYDLSTLLNNNNWQFEDYFWLNTFDKLQTLETEISNFQTLFLEKINQQVDDNKKAKMNALYNDIFSNDYASMVTKTTNAYAYFLNMHNMHQIIFNELNSVKNSPQAFESILKDYNISKEDIVNNAHELIIYIPLNQLGTNNTEFQTNKENIISFWNFVKKINDKKAQLMNYIQ